jgi:hypothetical protein
MHGSHALPADARLTGDAVLVTFEKAWDESKHPRHPAGSSQGGEWARVGFHGTKAEIEGEMRPSERGAYGPGVYLTDQPAVAQRYGDKVHEVAVRGEIFPALHGKLTPELDRRVAAQLTPDESKRLDGFRSWYRDDGNAFFEALVRSTRDEGKAVQALQRAGFSGIEGIADGHELNIFDPKDTRRQGVARFSKGNGMTNDAKRLTFSEFVDELYLKMGPTCGDVHVDVPLGDKKKKPKPHAAGPDKGSDPCTKSYDIIKSDDEQRMVYGWASVISEGGLAVIDTQGDIIEASELEKSTTEFMKDVRHAAEMHARNGDGSFSQDLAIGQVVHSFPLTKGFMDALGIDCDREGWIVGIHVTNDAVWDRVKKGELRAFSIGGHGNREPVE